MTLADAGKPIVHQLSHWMREGHDLVVDQAPELAQQLVTAGIIDSAVGVVFGVVLVAIAVGLVYFARVRHAEFRKARDFFCPESVIIAVIGASILGGIGLIFAFTQADQLLQILLAPKFYVLRELAKVVK